MPQSNTWCRRDRISNASIKKSTNAEQTIKDLIRTRRLKWFVESHQHYWSTKATSKTPLNQDQEEDHRKDGQTISKKILSNQA